MTKTQKQKLHEALYQFVSKYPNLRTDVLLDTLISFHDSIRHATKPREGDRGRKLVRNRRCDYRLV